MSLAAIILTKNEEQDLPDCLASLRSLADEVYVIDSGSTDATVAIAEAAGAVVLQHPFENYARQMNWAIENVPTKAEWLMRIDADEQPCTEMRQSLRMVVESPAGDVAGVLLARRTEFLGKKLRFGGTFPIWLLRVWPRGKGRCEDRWMDEHIVVEEGRVVRAHGELLHVIPKSLAEWSRKHVWYAEREYLDTVGAATGVVLQGQAGLVRKAKSGVYYRLPTMVRVLGFWMYRYVLQLGFLDGKLGFLYHFLQCGWYRMLVDGLIIEKRRGQMPARRSNPE
jgi:glycosyltransferase involved in cell wall biosynthesis